MSFAQQYPSVRGPSFVCPPDMRAHCDLVLRGEYDVPGLEFSEPPYILDIGANCGAFAVWATKRWHGARVDCYEPNPAALEYLRKNRHMLHPTSILDPRAVRAEGGKALLHFGKNNLGEASFYDLGEQRDEGVEVDCMAAAQLPDCDVLKLDVEGCEVEILDGYNANRWDNRPRAVLFEFHSEHDRKRIDARLGTRGYELVRGAIHRADRGTLCYVRAK